ncbi:MAG: ferredoxin--NADP reductase [Desulfotignum sp.]
MRFTIQLIHRRWLSDTIFELTFTKPAGFGLSSGQYIRFFFDKVDRDYTPVSLASDSSIRICVRKTGRGRFSDFLSRCPEGERFEISGPHGYFFYQASDRSDVFVGTGTGVAPFVAFARSGVSDYILLQGAKNPDDVIYRELLAPNSRQYVACISRAAGSGPFFHGRVTDFLADRLQPGTYQFFLSGRQDMILDAMEIIDDRFKDSKVFTERFF